MLCLNCMQEFDERYGVCPHCGFVPGTQPKEAYHLYPGTVLKNRYVIGTVVGFGGFGITYRAWDRTLERKIAVKEYYPNGLVNRAPGSAPVIVYSGSRADEFARGKSRFLNEARNMTRFNQHPNIVNVYEFFEENNTAYIAMEFLEGVSYKEYIKRQGGKVDAATAVAVVLSVLDALKELHGIGIIHRDVSPDNVFMVPAGEGNYQVKLIDFGAARFSTGEEEKTLSIVLKPGYAPPEQYRSKSRQGPWTDIYAVGAMLYRSLTGRMPEESVNRMVEDNLKQPAEINPEIPQYLNDAVMRAMALNQELRFKNTDQFREALLNKKKVRNVEEELKSRKRKRLLMIAALAAAVMAATAACFGVFLFKKSSLYGAEAVIAVWMPEINEERLELISEAAAIGTDGADERKLSLETSEVMLEEMLAEFTERFENVRVTAVTETAGGYEELVKAQAAAGSLPAVLETTGITPADSTVWNALGSLDTAYKTLDSSSCYFMEDEEFQTVFLKEYEKKQMPVSFCAPVLYVNTHMIADEERLSSLRSLDSVRELTDADGSSSFCVSTRMRDMYREAFAQTDDVDSLEEFAPADGQGYEAFLNREKAFYLGTTDDYEAVRSSLGGIYEIVVMESLQKSGRVKGRFTHLWSISAGLNGDEKTAAESLIYYLMNERAQDVLNVQAGNGLSMNRNMMQTYAEHNDEFGDIVDLLDTLKMRYD